MQGHIAPLMTEIMLGDASNAGFSRNNAGANSWFVNYFILGDRLLHQVVDSMCNHVGYEKHKMIKDDAGISMVKTLSGKDSSAPGAYRRVEAISMSVGAALGQS